MKSENGQKFKAYKLISGQREKVGQPFTAKRVTDKKVEAVDKHGGLRVFPFDIWRLEVVGS